MLWYSNYFFFLYICKYGNDNGNYVSNWIIIIFNELWRKFISVFIFNIWSCLKCKNL